MRSWAASLIAALLAALPAQATPPHVIWVEDHLFGRTDDRVLILRTINDNHGSHYTHQVDTFLLTVDRADGAVIAVASVQRSVSTFVGVPEDDGTTYTPLPDAVDPFAVRSDLGARPTGDPEPERWRELMVHPTAGVLVSQDGEVTHRLSMDKTRAQLIASLTRTRAVLPVIHQPGPVDEFSPVTGLSVARDCEADRVLTDWPPEDHPGALVRLTCDDRDGGGRNVFWVVVGPAG